jgi:transglutaminase-like putative cysteine protease
MKNTLIYMIALSLSFLLAGCGSGSNGLMKDQAVRERIASDFEAKKKELSEGGIFAPFDNADMTPDERAAMEFLYAYMPVGDAVDYTFDFYLENVRASFRAIDEMPWGKTIPADVLLHFVLPIRVNNENMDESRMVFYEELKERVRSLSLKDAVLEVNHFCHEKVIYTPSDARTSSPLASVRTGYGRCGEESVLVTAALRAVGIPARQVYTPRWAHTDDNHAWVEAWVEGRWYFIGACEPEPVLNMAWFNSPAYRTMLMHSKVFGKYVGEEEIIEQTDCYTEINVTSNYAPTARVSVTVVNESGQAVSDADVEFTLYNYAEFYPVSRKKSDAAGHASLSAGKGDMLVWASKDGKYGFAKVSFGKDESVTIATDHIAGSEYDIPLDIIPPVEGTIPVEVTEEQKAANAVRLAQEDSIRNGYTSTFYTDARPESIPAFAGLDKSRTDRLLVASRGNHRTIEDFINRAKDREAAASLLENISMKDLRDVTGDVLDDHLLNSGEDRSELYAAYIRNPRVSNEMLTPYKSFFRKEIPASLAEEIKSDPQAFVRWTADNIKIENRLNPQRIPASPAGVWKSRRADIRSRDIFFVSVLRSLGIASRIDQVAGQLQYAVGGQWMNVDFGSAASVIPDRGFITGNYIKEGGDPGYYSHFTIAKIQPDGRLLTLNFESRAQVDMGGGDTWNTMVANRRLSLEAGHYLLVHGTRMAKGNVLARIKTFDVLPGQTTVLDMNLRNDTEDIRVIGSMDAETKFTTMAGTETSILATTGRGYFIIGMITPSHEPSNHALRDISSLASEFDKWQRPIILLFKDKKTGESFNPSEFAPLPSAVTYGTDESGAIRKMLSGTIEQTEDMPVFIIADTFGRVVFASHGYTIGLGAQMMKIINKL